jgi:hypothetical protein
VTGVEHQPVVFGPVAEGDETISGGVYPMPGYGWSCTCRAAGFGYETEDEAGDWADRHVADPGFVSPGEDTP